MATLTAFKKKNLKNLIKGLRLIKDKYLAKNIEETHSTDVMKFKGICACANRALYEEEIDSKTYYAIDDIVRKALVRPDGYHFTWLSEAVANLNPNLSLELIGSFSHPLQHEVRHMWLDQLINDYTKMLKEGSR